jgi:tripartite-type tricarboxylate transporter receptor subunit TctC
MSMVSMTVGVRSARALILAPLLVNLAACVVTGGREGPTDARSFFQGKTMTYIVVGGPGGGYDQYGRLVSRYLAKHLGLNKAVVKNSPGGGQILGANEVYHAPPDGLTLGTFNTGVIYAQLLRRQGLHVDLRRMSWIGKAGDEPRVLVVSKRSGFRTLEDIRRTGRPLVLGASGFGTAGYNDAVLIAHAIGLPIKTVLGLETQEAQLSMMRGDTHGDIASASSYRRFVENGYGHFVMRVGRGPGVDDRLPDAADLATSVEGKELINLIRSQSTLLRWTAGPPGIPEDRLALLRDAYMAALNDPGLREDARTLDIPIAPMDGATLSKEVARVLAQPPRTVALMASILGVELEAGP